ncbi:hypothetical protein LY76DRAFT_385206 [Colletotrichum caudatum]|nr:hypothetical protein LY76DRAFT_385206 [Colletotrichum caudatum]
MKRMVSKNTPGRLCDRAPEAGRRGQVVLSLVRNDRQRRRGKRPADSHGNGRSGQASMSDAGRRPSVLVGSCVLRKTLNGCRTSGNCWPTEERASKRDTKIIAGLAPSKPRLAMGGGNGARPNGPIERGPRKAEGAGNRVRSAGPS